MPETTTIGEADFAVARNLDERDPLAWFRNRHYVADPEEVYLDGNSLGRLPMPAAYRVEKLMQQEWGQRLVGGWNDGWWMLSRKIGDKIGQLIGARPGETVVADSTTINLYKLIGAFVAADRMGRPILVDATNFPTDIYVAGRIAESSNPPRKLIFAECGNDDVGVPSALAAAFSERPGVAVLSHVAFRSGYRFDIAAVEKLARQHDVAVIWDLSHSVGAVPLDVDRDGVKAAVGCTYKYLNGGPGAPAFLYVRKEIQDLLDNPLPGWFGHADPFAMERDFRSTVGIAKFLTGTPPILSLAAIEAGVDLILEAGIAALWKKGNAQIELLRMLVERFADRHGLSIATPKKHHGSHLTVCHPNARSICVGLIQRKVIPDFRPPDVIRLAVAPVYTRYVDLVEAAVRFESLLEKGEWQALAKSDLVVT